MAFPAFSASSCAAAPPTAALPRCLLPPPAHRSPHPLSLLCWPHRRRRPRRWLPPVLARPRSWAQALLQAAGRSPREARRQAAGPPAGSRGRRGHRRACREVAALSRRIGSFNHRAAALKTRGSAQLRQAHLKPKSTPGGWHSSGLPGRTKTLCSEGCVAQLGGTGPLRLFPSCRGMGRHGLNGLPGPGGDPCHDGTGSWVARREPLVGGCLHCMEESKLPRRPHQPQVLQGHEAASGWIRAVPVGGQRALQARVAHRPAARGHRRNEAASAIIRSLCSSQEG